MGQFKKEGVFSAEILVLISVFSCKDYRLQNMISSHLQIKSDFMKTKEKKTKFITFTYPSYYKWGEN